MLKDEILDKLSLFFYNISYTIFLSFGLLSFGIGLVAIKNKDYIDIFIAVCTFWSFGIIVLQLWRDAIDRNIENAFKRISLVSESLENKRFFNYNTYDYCNNIKVKILEKLDLENHEIEWCKLKLTSYIYLLDYLLFLKEYKIPRTIFYSHYIINHLGSSDIYSFYIDIAKYSELQNIFVDDVTKCNMMFKEL